ncbi:MAG: TylF/MycF/NovP-related O-methyltransferase [Candidatus Latescibacterota bacterium]
MKAKLYLIRKTKALFLKFRLHVLIEPFSGLLINLAYLSKLSKWRVNTPSPVHNDFYSRKVDYSKRYELYRFILEEEQLSQEIDYLEFGVAQGASFKWWISNNRCKDSRFVGFDTFTGLPEDWHLFKQGAMSASGESPEIDDERCEFKAGLFQKTLPIFLKEFHSDRKLVIHLDADLYSSTLYVLTAVAPVLKGGDILIFDEFGVPSHEFRAFTDFVHSYYLEYELLAASNNYLQIAVKVK